MWKSKLKKTLSIVSLPILVLVCMLQVSINTHAATAEEVCETLDLSEYILQEGGLNVSAVYESESGIYTMDEEHWLSNGSESLENTLYNGLKNKADSIDLSSYKLVYTDFHTDFHTVFYSVINKHPELFYATGGVTVISSGGYVSVIYPKYDSSYTDEDIRIFNQKIEQIIAGVDSSWPTIEKILYLHDYLVTNIEYDTSLSKHNAYNALVEGSSVCQGYSLAFVCLMNHIGVNVDIITSNELDHAWNLIELDGEYFLCGCNLG